LLQGFYGAYMDSATKLDEVQLANVDGIATRLLSVRWNGVNLAGIDWGSVKKVIDEEIARSPMDENGVRKNAPRRNVEYREAVQTYRQLQGVLQSQGLADEAGRFAYRARVLQRILYRRQRKLGKYVALSLLAMTGYGYKFGRAVAVYLATIGSFGIFLWLAGSISKVPLTVVDSLVISVTSFHGRGIASLQGFSLSSPLAIMSAIEAVVGLMIEATVIATLTQRLIGR